MGGIQEKRERGAWCRGSQGRGLGDCKQQHGEKRGAPTEAKPATAQRAKAFQSLS